MSQIKHPHDPARTSTESGWRDLWCRARERLRRFTARDGAHIQPGVQYPAGRPPAPIDKRAPALTEELERPPISEPDRLALAEVIEATPDVVGITNLGGQCVFLNAAAREMLGVEREGQASTPRLWDYFSEPHQAVVRALAIPEAIRDGSWSGEVTIQASDGRTLPTSLVVIAHRGADGEVDHLSWIARDLSERRALEERAREAQTLDALGRLAGGIAHDFNNLLTSIIGHADLLLKTSPDNEVRADASEIKEAGERAAALTKQLLAFSRQQVAQPRVLDLNAVLAQLASRLRSLIGGKIELVTFLDGALAPFKSDAEQIEHVVISVVQNACEAMPHGGRLTIETADTQLDMGAATELGLPAPGRYSRLTVSDTGRGMDEQTRARIFEPFFSTKTEVKGTGLGLTAVYGIVRQGGGRIRVESEPGEGTTVSVYFPAIDPQFEIEEPLQGVDASAEPGTILLAEDESAVLNLAARVLRGQGFRVLEARDGSDALRVQAEHAGTIDLLLTDVVMPKMGGLELAERLLRIRPSTRVVYMSGYADNPAVRSLLEDETTAFLHKPFTPGALANLVRKVIAGSSR